MQCSSVLTVFSGLAGGAACQHAVLLITLNIYFQRSVYSVLYDNTAVQKAMAYGTQVQ
jgi:hypothetical protein